MPRVAPRPGALTFSVAEAAEKLGYGTQTLYDHLDETTSKIVFEGGLELPVIRLGRKMRIPRIAVQRLLGEVAAQ